MALGDSDSEEHRAQAAAADDDDVYSESESDQEGHVEADDEALLRLPLPLEQVARRPDLESVTMISNSSRRRPLARAEPAQVLVVSVSHEPQMTVQSLLASPGIIILPQSSPAVEQKSPCMHGICREIYG